MGDSEVSIFFLQVLFLLKTFWNLVGICFIAARLIESVIMLCALVRPISFKLYCCIKKSQNPFPRPMEHRAAPISVSIALGHVSAKMQ